MNVLLEQDLCCLVKNTVVGCMDPTSVVFTFYSKTQTVVSVPILLNDFCCQLNVCEMYLPKQTTLNNFEINYTE